MDGYTAYMFSSNSTENSCIISNIKIQSKMSGIFIFTFFYIYFLRMNIHKKVQQPPTERAMVSQGEGQMVVNESHCLE